jgi:CheY-like chemotaxis protein
VESPSRPSPTRKMQEPPVNPQPTSPAAGVLVAEDDAAIRAVLGTALHEHGLTAWLATNGLDALELFRQHRHEISAVLLDVLMPRLDGPATLAAIRQIDPQVPCCFMSGYSANYSEQELLALGAVRVFDKPFRLHQIIEVLEQLCGLPPDRGQTPPGGEPGSPAPKDDG